MQLLYIYLNFKTIPFITAWARVLVKLTWTKGQTDQRSRVRPTKGQRSD